MQIVYTNFKRDARIQRRRLILLESPLANVMSNPGSEVIMSEVLERVISSRET